jgi:hypothetical protein
MERDALSSRGSGCSSGFGSCVPSLDPGGILREMTGEQIKSLYQAVPFEAFRVHMADGRSIDVPHPDFMHLSPTGRRLIVDRSDDSFEVIDVLLVTSVETLSRNGTKSRRRPR